MQVDYDVLCIFFTIFKHDVVYSALSICLAINNIIKNKSRQKKRTHQEDASLKKATK